MKEEKVWCDCFCTTMKSLECCYFCKHADECTSQGKGCKMGLKARLYKKDDKPWTYCKCTTPALQALLRVFKEEKHYVVREEPTTKLQ